MTNRFGRRLYQRFFQTYTEKVWGIPCHQIRADWAAQRIKGLSLKTAVTNALFGRNDAKTLIKEFDYPRLGPRDDVGAVPGARARQAGKVRLETDIVAIVVKGTGSRRRRPAQGFDASVRRGECHLEHAPPRAD